MSRNHQLRSLEIKTETHFLQSRLPHGMPQLRLVFLGVEHQEAAAAGADQLAAERAVGAREIVPFVDLRIAHAATARLLALPMLVHQPRELSQVTALQRALA